MTSKQKDRDGWLPGDYIGTARLKGQVIECTGPSGVTHSFVPALPGDDLWAARCDLPRGDSRTWVVSQQREDTIENCIKRCEPDVRLVSESESTFTGDTDGD